LSHPTLNACFSAEKTSSVSSNVLTVLRFNFIANRCRVTIERTVSVLGVLIVAIRLLKRKA
jgi:hypothetical protein